MNGKTEINGWIMTGTDPQKYQMSIDYETYHTGTRSATIKSVANEFEAGDFITMMQQFNSRNFLSKRVRLSGFIKTRDVSAWCGLWMRLDNAVGSALKLDNMQTRPIAGTTEWNHYSCVLDVPENAAIINIGVLMFGSGQVWLDNISFQEVDRNTPTTDFTPEEIFPDYPQNLSFEE